MTSLEVLRSRRVAELRQRRDAGQRLSPTEREALAAHERHEATQIDRAEPGRRAEAIDEAVRDVYPSRTYEDRVAAQLARTQLHQRERDRELARARADLLDDREINALVGKVVHHGMAAEGLTENARFVSPRGHEALEHRRIINAHAMGTRSGWTSDAVEQQEAHRSFATVDHPEAGRLRLATDGEHWTIGLHGAEFALGPVAHSERHHGEDGTPTYRPRREVREAAAQRALSHPAGPPEPVGSPVFVGRADGGIDEVVRVVEPAPEPGVITRVRERIAARLAATA